MNLIYLVIIKKPKRNARESVLPGIKDTHAIDFNIHNK